MGTSQVLPVLLIVGGLLMIGVGGILGTLGWNKAASVSARTEMIMNLHDAARANQRILMNTVEADSIEVSLPVETAQFTAALAGGYFVGPQHADLRDSVRRAQSVLTEYNYALSHKYAATVWAHGPKDLPQFAADGASAVEVLADLLESRYGIKP